MLARTSPRCSSATPRIVTRDGPGLVAFLQAVFEARGAWSADAPTIVEIGDARLMIVEATTWALPPGFLYVYVDDLDATYARAVAAGARIVDEPTLTPFGDRRAKIEDRWGNTWEIAAYCGP